MMTQWILFAAETAEGGGLFDFDATLPLMAIQFLVLAWLLNILLYSPLGKAIDDRAGYVQGKFSDAEKQKQQSLDLAQQYEQELKDVRKQSQEVIATAQAEAQAVVTSQVQEAQQEVIAQRQKASEEIEAEREQALADLEKQVDALSEQIVSKFV